MILPIHVYGTPVLRKKGINIEPDYPELDQLIEDMWSTMHHAEGIGLAAPQVGKAIRLFLVDATPLEEDFPECKDLKLVAINPSIEILSDKNEIHEEGCLSIPNLRAEVSRTTKIKLTYLDENFTPQERTLEGFAARVVLHEYDHIEGVLFVDKISPLKRRMIQNKLTNISKGKTDTSYRIITP